MTLAGVVLAGIVASGTGGRGFGARVGILSVDGVIRDGSELLRQLRELRRDPSVRALVVEINSPGGAVAPSQSLFREIRRMAEEGTPVVATIGSVGASGGYYVALGADSIFALPGSITGSIGVLMEFPDLSGLLDRIGVRMDVVKSAEHKDVGSPFRPMTEGDRELLQGVVSDVYEQFVDAVVAERGLDRDKVLSLADGRILSGRQALEAGLIDRLGDRHDAISAAGRMAGLGPEPRVRRAHEERLGILDLLRGVRPAGGGPAAWLKELWGPRLKYLAPE